MGLSILQQPSSLQLAQSPVMYSVSTQDNAFLSQSFQYTCTLQYWKGAISDSGSGNTYVVNKYPNLSGSGMFDFSRILNSTLRDNIIENTSSMTYYKPTFNYQYYDGGWITDANVTGSVRAVLDGYSIWPEAINADVMHKGLYPFLTDGPVTQSIFQGDSGSISVDASGITANVIYSGSNGSNGSISQTGASNSKNIIKIYHICLL